MSPNSTEQAGAETPEARTHDAYTPQSGDTSFDVEAYALDLSYRVRTNRLEGCATLSIRIVVATSSIALDLVGLLHPLLLQHLDRSRTRQKIDRTVDAKQSALKLALVGIGHEPLPQDSR